MCEAVLGLAGIQIYAATSVVAYLGSGGIEALVDRVLRRHGRSGEDGEGKT